MPNTLAPNSSKHYTRNLGTFKLPISTMDFGKNGTDTCHIADLIEMISF